MGKIVGKKSSKATKSLGLKFSIDCQKPVDDQVIETKDFVEFLSQKIKVNGKTGNLGEDIKVKEDGAKVVVSSNIPFAKRYLKYLTKKYLKKQELKNYLYVISNDKDKASYRLEYFVIQQGAADEE